MSPRNRLALALSHKEPDAVPYDQSSRSSAIEEEAYADLRSYLGGPEGDVSCFLRSHAEWDRPVQDLLGVDTEFIRYFSDDHWSMDDEGRVFTDAWGVPWRKKPGCLYYEIDAYPLESAAYEEILNQDWPPLIDAELADILKSRAESAFAGSDRGLFCDQIGAGLFERAWYLRGLENFLVDLVLEKDKVRAYLDKILEHQIEGYRVLLDALGPFIQGVLLTDDLASQEGPLISPDMYREMLFPYHRKLLDFLSSQGTRVVFHSCGAVADLIPDLMDAGVDILHPIQHSARGMSPREIKNEYGGELVIWGAGCDTELLQTGRPDEITDDVRKTLDFMAPGGGFVFTTTHCIQAGTPPQNILAMSRALRGENFSPGEFQGILNDKGVTSHG